MVFELGTRDDVFVLLVFFSGPVSWLVRWLVGFDLVCVGQLVGWSVGGGRIPNDSGLAGLLRSQGGWHRAGLNRIFKAGVGLTAFWKQP